MRAQRKAINAVRLPLDVALPHRGEERCLVETAPQFAYRPHLLRASLDTQLRRHLLYALQPDPLRHKRWQRLPESVPAHQIVGVTPRAPPRRLLRRQLLLQLAPLANPLSDCRQRVARLALGAEQMLADAVKTL